ncbi:hypothetical protein QFZ74_005662 [Streptomyces sp. V3I7]|nr:hypothetical protein [Streptomyces sp. V3I7]MDQ0989777.1 hypothetical protein [Streptomyces sp. V3I7]MDQ0994434.1 hypothetical protein [Streptomyces sp. V3I7]
MLDRHLHHLRPNPAKKQPQRQKQNLTKHY